MHKLLNSNAASVATNLSCRNLGHFASPSPPPSMPPSRPQESPPPLNPGAMTVIPAGTTGPEAASTQYAHDTATLAFNTFVNVDRALRQQLLGAVNDTFLRVLHKPHRGYSGSITLDLLTHLYVTYAVISNASCLENNKRFRKPYSPSIPIKVAWRQSTTP